MKVTYLGVAASPANELLADQLRLGKGTGLVVDFVEEDSPAAKAGIKPHDVLLKLNDQILVNPPQLAVLVRLQKPGDKVTLTLVREAKEQKVTAELTETERMVGGGLDDFFVRPVQPGTWLKMPDPWMTEPERRAAEDARAEAARRHLEEARRLGAIAPPGAAHVSVSAAMSDGEHNLTLTITDGEKHLVAKDKDGKVVFEGPVRTDEQRAKMPPQIRKKLEKMEATTRFEVHTRFEGPDQVDEHLRGPIDEMRKHMERLNPAPAPIEPHRPEVAL
jgi:membrane-associated protease RseP (regulator of RpoE activity)